MMRILWCFVVLLTICAGASVNPTGIIVSRKPEIMTSTSADMPISTSTKTDKKPTKTAEEPSPTEDTEENLIEPTATMEKPRPTMNPKIPDSEPETPTSPPSTDPTDYSTVLPTRWHPRRRFGAQNEAPPQYKPDWKLISFMLIGIVLL